MTLMHAAPSRTDGAANDSDDAPVKIRPPRLEHGDGEAMWRLARESGVLEENAEYTYHMFSHFFGEACVVAEIDGRAAGFIAGFRPPDRRDSVFVWQIAVDQQFRGRGIAAAMLHGLVERLSPEVQFLEATVAPSNEASQRAFRGVARDLNTLCLETVLFPGDRFGGPCHEDEVLFRIGPIEPAAIAKHGAAHRSTTGAK